MTKQKFDLFWEASWLPKIKKLESKFLKIEFDYTLKDKVYEEYENQRDHVHSFMVVPDKRIDRHKVGAIITNVILQLAPFSEYIDKQQENAHYPTVEYFPNEVLAWHCGISVVFSFLLEELKQQNKLSEIKILEKKGFAYPKTEYCQYQIHILRSLFHAKRNGGIDIFSFSHVLFFIEYINKQFYKV